MEGDSWEGRGSKRLEEAKTACVDTVKRMRHESDASQGGEGEPANQPARQII